MVEIKNANGVIIERYQTLKDNQSEIKNGLYERFDDQGNLLEQSNFVNGKLNGIRKLFINGKLESEENRVDDQYQGMFKSYHTNGNLQMEANYVNNVITGDVKVYYSSGPLKEIVRFEDNVENGAFKEFYENGKTKAEGNYKQLDGAVEDGELKLYDSTGTLERIMDCELGKCKTRWTKDTLSVQ